MRNYNYIEQLEKEVKAGEKHFYIFNKPLNVAIWYDCLLY